MDSTDKRKRSCDMMSPDVLGSRVAAASANEPTSQACGGNVMIWGCISSSGTECFSNIMGPEKKKIMSADLINTLIEPIRKRRSSFQDEWQDPSGSKEYRVHQG